MIGPYFDGGRVLDLFAGSGGLSIEAISRGMEEAVLVEKDWQAQKVIAANIAMTKETSKFQLLKMDADRALSQLSGEFDLIFLDPPYAEDVIVKTLEDLEGLGLLSPDIKVVCETEKSVILPEQVANLSIWKQKAYGISKVTVYVR